MNVAVIPARAGSKGVPGKNTRTLNGVPLFMWSVEAALACDRIGVVVVTSDDPVVLELTKARRARLPSKQFERLLAIDRPVSLSRDDTPTEPVVQHAIDRLRGYGVKADRSGKIEWIALLQPTSPVRNFRLLSRCFDAVTVESGWDSLLTCSVHTPFFYRSNGSAVGHDPRQRRRRQEIEATGDLLYHDNGNVYLTRAEVWDRVGNRVGSRPRVFPCTDYQSWQVDREEDFTILEAMSKTFGPFIDGVRSRARGRK